MQEIKIANMYNSLEEEQAASERIKAQNKARTEKARKAKAEKHKNKNKIKKRVWAFVVYPESAPSDWIEQLRLTGIQIAISPLHDKDLDPTEGHKKAHYHIIACYGGPTTYANVKQLTDVLNAPIPIALETVGGYYRYFTHKDNPDKYQYDEREIKTLNGFNIADYVGLTNSEVNEIKRKLQTLIRQNNIIEYAEFMNYLQDLELFTEYDIASSHTIFFNAYITSFRNVSKSSQGD